MDWPRYRQIDGVEVRCENRWWGKQYAVTGESPFVVAEKLVLFISERGMDHGFWRDLRVGAPVFDARFFVFCDTPALLPIIVGERVRAALSNTGPNRHDIELYVRDGRVKTTGLAHHKDPAALERHVAIHSALAEDHRQFLAGWKQRMDSAAGRADATWPPTATLMRPSGVLLVNLWWTAPTSRDGADWDDAAESMRTEVTAHDDRPRIKWTLRAVSATTPCTHIFADKRYTLTGKVPFALPVLESIIRQSALASISVEDKTITVGVRGIATPSQLEGAVRVIHLIVEAGVDTTSPYR